MYLLYHHRFLLVILPFLLLRFIYLLLPSVSISSYYCHMFSSNFLSLPISSSSFLLFVYLLFFFFSSCLPSQYRVFPFSFRMSLAMFSRVSLATVSSRWLLVCWNGIGCVCWCFHLEFSSWLLLELLWATLSSMSSLCSAWLSAVLLYK